MKQRLLLRGLKIGLTILPFALGAQTEVQLAPYTVLASPVAMPEPAGGVAQTVSALRMDARIDLQARGAPEQQGDVTIRGGTFEQTGFALGVLPILDPQTGHYFGELPFDPRMLSAATVELGATNALRGFNSAVGTIRYGWAPVSTGATVEAGFGSDDLNYQRLYVASASEGSGWGGDLSAARSEGDGSIAFGEHEFIRVSARLQRRTTDSQTDFFFGYSDEFYGWPGMYTGFALNEIDDYQIRLAGLNHRQRYGEDSVWEAGAYYRGLTDTYDFIRNRELAPGEDLPFDHETQVLGAAFGGVHQTETLAWHYQATVVVDELIRSTSLTNAGFTERTYTKLAVLPTWQTVDSDGTRWEVGGGLSLDTSSEDDTHLAPQAFVQWQAAEPAWGTWRVDYSETSQVPGYTALGSNPVGLFGGNADLDREVARTLAASWEGPLGNHWHLGATLFHRWDDDLVDWTFDTASPNARQANALDAETLGAEVVAVGQWETLRVALSYTYLDKDADYGTATVDASYYALNFAEHRATAAVAWTPVASITLRTDLEARRQAANPLRSTGRDAFLIHTAIDWQPDALADWTFSALIDNATEDDFQDFPGTPAPGRQVSLRVRRDW